MSNGCAIAALMIGKIGRQWAHGEAHGFATAFALLLLRIFLGICLRLARLGGVFDRGRRALARVLRFAHGSRHSCYAVISHLRPPYPSDQEEGHRSAKR